MSFLRDLLATASPTKISFARAITLVIVAFVLVWDSAYVWQGIHLGTPDILPDSGTMAGQVALMTAFYVVNKGHDAVDNHFNRQAEPEHERHEENRDEPPQDGTRR